MGSGQRTRIKYRVYTSYKYLKLILEELQQVKLLMYDPYSETYHTTDKGKRFSVMYRELQKVGSGKGSTGFRTFDPN